MKKVNGTEPSGTGVDRRGFLKSAAGAAAFTVVPRYVIGGAGTTPPSEKLNIAGVGIGGMGKNNIRKCSGENIVALCDVDDKYAGPVFKDYPKAKKYLDFRDMLDKQKDIDRGYRGDAGPHARGRGVGRDGIGQARVCAEAHHAFGVRGAHPDGKRRGSTT